MVALCRESIFGCCYVTRDACLERSQAGKTSNLARLGAVKAELAGLNRIPWVLPNR